MEFFGGVMAGVPGRSGGWNRLSADEHVIRGTFRRDRHAAIDDRPAAPTSAADRRRTLQGLNPEARRMAAALVDTYEGWDAAALTTLRAYALSCERLAVLQAAAGEDTRALHREIRSNLALLRALNLEAR